MIQKSQQQLDAYFKNQKDGIVIYEEAEEDSNILEEGSLQQISRRLTSSYNFLLQNDAFSATTGISTGNSEVQNLIGPDTPIFFEQQDKEVKKLSAS